MSASPPLSVVVPVFNAAALVGPLLEDLRRTSLAGCEILVVDDGSTDDTAARCEAVAGVRVLRLGTNRGPATARNRGAAAASSDVLVFVDADVRLPADRDLLRDIREVFDRDPEVDCVSSPSHVQPIARSPIAYNNAIYHQYYVDRVLAGRDTFRGHLMFFSTRLGAIRRERFRQSGGFHEALWTVMNEDGEFWTRSHPLGLVTWLDRDLVHHHLYPTRLPRFARSFYLSAMVQYFIDRKMDTRADPTITPSEKARRLLALAVAASPLTALALGPQALALVTLPLALAFVASFGPMNRLVWRHVPAAQRPGWYLAYVAITPCALAGYLAGMVRYLRGERLIDGAPSAHPFFTGGLRGC